MQVLKLHKTAQKKKHFFSKKPPSHKEYCLIQRARLDNKRKFGEKLSQCEVSVDELHDSLAPHCAVAHAHTINSFF